MSEESRKLSKLGLLDTAKKTRDIKGGVFK